MIYLQSRAHEPVILDLALVTPNRSKLSPIAPGDRVTGFYLYLDEMGLAQDFLKYRVLLGPELQHVNPYRFVSGKVDWSDFREVQALRRFARRARHSLALRKVLHEVLLQGGSSQSREAREILEKMGALALDPSQPASATDALCSSCQKILNSQEWKSVPQLAALREQLEGRSASQMRAVPGFSSACQTFFAQQTAP